MGPARYWASFLPSCWAMPGVHPSPRSLHAPCCWNRNEVILNVFRPQDFVLLPQMPTLPFAQTGSPGGVCVWSGASYTPGWGPRGQGRLSPPGGTPAPLLASCPRRLRARWAGQEGEDAWGAAVGDQARLGKSLIGEGT